MSTDIRFFNVHTEALGYINNLTEVPGKNGKFWTSKFTALEGNPNSPEKIHIDFTLPGKNTLDVLLPYRDAINAETKVIAVVRYAKFRGTPFVYPQTSQLAGQLGINYSATLINVLYLKVEDLVVFDHRNEKPAPQEHQGAPSSNSGHSDSSYQAASKDQSSPVLDNVPGAASVESLFNPPVTVKLTKDYPNFAEKKEELKSSGYRWNSELFFWTLKSVQLSKDDPQFAQKKVFLENLGYRWNKESKSWDMAFQRPSRYSNQRSAA